MLIFFLKVPSFLPPWSPKSCLPCLLLALSAISASIAPTPWVLGAVVSKLTHRCSSLSMGPARADQSVTGGVCWLNDIGSLKAPFRIYCKSLPLNSNMVLVSPTPLPSQAWVLAACTVDSSRACNIICVQLEEASLSFSLFFFFLNL